MVNFLQCLFLGAGCQTPFHVGFTNGWVSLNMNQISSLNYPVGTVATFNCWNNANLVLVGPKRSTCKKSGLWIPEPPSCIPGREFHFI